MSEVFEDVNLAIKIQEAKTEDLEALLRLNHELHENETLLEITSKTEKIWGEIIDDRRLHCFMAYLDGEAVGTCMLDIVPNLTRGARPFGVLQNVVTAAKHRGKGIGRKLNQHVLNFAWSKNCYQVLVQTGRPAVTSFYEKLGFRPDKIGLVAKPEWQNSTEAEI